MFLENNSTRVFALSVFSFIHKSVNCYSNNFILVFIVTMESSVVSDFTVKTFHANYDDIKNFTQFIQKLESECKNEGAVKVIPPSQFQPGTKVIPYNHQFPYVVAQRADRIQFNNSHAYELAYNDRSSMLHKEFISKTVLNEHPHTSIDLIEDLSWDALAKNDGPSLYSMNNDLSLFSDSCRWLNLNKFTHAESIIHKHVSPSMKGIHSPYVYVGSWPTYFGFHIEDANLNSINFLHRGSPKFWYIVPSDDGGKLERLGNQFGEIVSSTCKNFLRHKALLVPPSVLRQHGIRFGRIAQYPNEFVVTFSGGYHQGFNSGLNEAEAINFGTKRWLELFEQYNPCDCRDRHANSLSIINNLACSYESSVVEQQKRPFVCDICTKSFTSKPHLKRHILNSHAPSRPQFTCSICGSIFNRIDNLKAHAKGTHGAEVPDADKQCSFIPNVQQTTRKKTLQLGSLACRVCDLVVKGKSSLKRHEKNKHNILE